MIIGQPLKQALADTGISAAELARRMGKSRSYISQLVNGTCAASEDTLHELAAHLGCQVSIDIRFTKIKG